MSDHSLWTAITSGRGDMLKLIEISDGVSVAVIAKPGASANKILGVHDGRLRVAVTAAPEKGKANAAIEDVLAKAFGVARRQVSQVTGATSREKAFAVSGVTLESVVDALAKLCIATGR